MFGRKTIMACMQRNWDKGIFTSVKSNYMYSQINSVWHRGTLKAQWPTKVATSATVLSDAWKQYFPPLNYVLGLEPVKPVQSHQLNQATYQPKTIITCRFTKEIQEVFSASLMTSLRNDLLLTCNRSGNKRTCRFLLIDFISNVLAMSYILLN